MVRKMNDISKKVFIRQTPVKWMIGDNVYHDRGILIPLNKSKSTLQLKMQDEIRGFEHLFYLFYGSYEPDQKTDCELVHDAVRYRGLSSKVIYSGKQKIAVRTVLERCCHEF